MRSTDDTMDRPQGAMTRLVLPGMALAALGACFVLTAMEFVQEVSNPPNAKGYQLVTTTVSIDAPKTPTDFVADQPIVAIKKVPQTAQSSAAVSSSKTAISDDETAAVAAIKAAAPLSVPAVDPESPVEHLAYSAAPDTGAGDPLVVIGNGPLNVRSGPSTEHDKVFSLGAGQVVDVLERQKDWTRIKDEDDRTGWAATRFMVALAEAEKIAAEAAAKREATMTMTVRSGVNVRSGPGRSYEKVFGLSAGNAVTVLDRSKGWIRVETEDRKKGWVYSSFLR